MFRNINGHADVKLHLEGGRGGGSQVVSVVAFSSDAPNSNPAEVYNFAYFSIFGHLQQ